MRRRDETDGRPSGPGLLVRLWREERAVTMAFTAVALTVMVAATAIGVDLGMVTAARVQSQRAADAGALAGAGELAMQNGSSSGAREEAKEFANRHHVLSDAVTVGNADVVVDEAEGTVTVRVRHDVQTFFARIVGISRVPVSTTATAEVAPANAAVCPIPVMAVDRWIDDDGDGLFDDGETYDSCRDGEPCTGFSIRHEGALLEVKSQNTSSGGSAIRTCGAENPEWYCWVDNQVGVGSVGVPELEDILFNGCENTAFEIAIDEDLEASPGNKMSVVQSLKSFIDRNGGSSLAWRGDPLSCVWNGFQCVEGEHPRIRAMPVTDPTTIQATGEGARATVDNFVGVFLEKVSDAPDQPHGHGPPGEWNLYVRLLEGAFGGLGASDGHPNSLLRAVVLVN